MKRCFYKKLSVNTSLLRQYQGQAYAIQTYNFDILCYHNLLHIWNIQHYPTITLHASTPTITRPYYNTYHSLHFFNPSFLHIFPCFIMFISSCCKRLKHTYNENCDYMYISLANVELVLFALGLNSQFYSNLLSGME